MQKPKQINILGIAGSLRKKSFNMLALKTAKDLAPEKCNLEIYNGLASIPPYNQDQEASMPESVLDLKKKIQHADAILFATPEYNYSIPGVLKNAIDWASRPYGESAWEGKPVGIMSASISRLGGVRAQNHLRQTFVSLDMHPLNQPEVLISSVHKKVDENGNLTDSHTKEKIEKLLKALLQWTQKINRKI